MLKQILLLSVLGVSLTGCVVAPYDDIPNRYDQRYDHKHDGDKRWDHRNDKRWENRRDQRDWNRDRRDWNNWDNR